MPADYVIQATTSGGGGYEFKLNTPFVLEDTVINGIADTLASTLDGGANVTWLTETDHVWREITIT